MRKTNIRVTFSIYGEKMSLTDITDKLNLEPDEYYKKNDPIKTNPVIKKKEDCWCLDKGAQETLNLNEPLNELLELIREKDNELIEIKRLYNANVKFDIVIIIEDEELPAVYLEQEIIQFAGKICADIDFDMYIN
ncbi:DUF4279 domain-containing protein [Viridibacillus sp. NPDC093762]|uniref:DUF4279 domain-containing protein n=1 Tax=Viridibacillus sp. NPDC093762 TaxID=3390720 RepID=UPI003CFBC7EC